MNNYVTPFGDRTPGRLPASTRRHASAIASDRFIASVEMSAIDRLASTAMQGQHYLCESARILSAGDPYIASQMLNFVRWAAFAKMEVASDTVERWHLC